MSHIPISQVLRGVFSALCAAIIFSGLWVVAKSISAKYHIVEVVFFRYVFALIPPLLYGLYKGGSSGWKITVGTPFDHGLRGVVGGMGALLLFQAFLMMPLSDAVTLSFSNTLFMCMLSGTMLGEKVDLHRWVAILFGFIGIVIIASPKGDVFNYGTFLVLLCGIMDAYVLLKGRFFSQKMPIYSVIVYYNIAAALGLALFLPFFWVTPISWGDLFFLSLVGLLGGIGQLFLTQAYRLAPASTVSPISYTSAIWSSVAAYLVFGEIPAFKIYIGAAIIVASGIYIVTHETVKRKTVRLPGNDSKKPKKMSA